MKAEAQKEDKKKENAARKSESTETGKQEDLKEESKQLRFHLAPATEPVLTTG